MILFLCLICMVIPFLSSCTDDSDTTVGVWYRRADLTGLPRTQAAAFTIDNIGYICTGYKTGSGTEKRLNDIWAYHIDGNYWTECNSMPSEAGYRNRAAGFAVGEKGYVTTGYNSSSEYLADTWEYDPSSDSWAQKDDFVGGARYGALAFSIGNYGYVGQGYNDNWLSDYYRFNPNAASGSQWEKVNGYGGQKRVDGTAFVINDKAYICCGTSNGTYPSDFWRFDPSETTAALPMGTFTALRDIADTSDDDYDDDYAIVRAAAVAFVIDGKGYLTTGTNGSLKTDYWIYNPDTDLWTGDSDDDYTPFALLNSGYQGSSRSGAVSFSTGTKGFVLAGSTSSTNLDDMYELSPYEDRDE
nr:kelch repeat-containing protein [uncultured Bacteroides sp.]